MGSSSRNSLKNFLPEESTMIEPKKALKQKSTPVPSRKPQMIKPK